jgi:hypothetical protein
MMLIETGVRSSAIHGMGLFAVALVSRGMPAWRIEPGISDGRLLTPALSSFGEEREKRRR